MTGIFAKAPVPGRVKTRLVERFGASGAARIYEACLRDVIDLAATVDPNILLFVDDDPHRPHSFWEDFDHLQSLPQRGDDLGGRLKHAFDELLRREAVATVIGSDSPTLPSARITEARKLLRDFDVVFGPAFDGGYYLVGLRREAWPRAATIFRGIPWSTPATLEASLEQAREARLSVALLDPWYDIDEPKDVTRARVDAAENSHLARILRSLDLPSETSSR